MALLPRRIPLCVCAALLLAKPFSTSAQEPATTLPPPLVPAANDPLDICALPVTRLVFTLADLSAQSCGDDTSKCRSLCSCRAWSTLPVTGSTLALCVAVDATAACSGDARDCSAVLAAQNATSTTSTFSSGSSSSDSHAINATASDSKTDTDDTESKGGISTSVSVVIAVLCTAILAGILFAAYWFRNRPRSISAPATVSGGVQLGPPMTLTEIDIYDEKLPGHESGRPTHRGSLSSQPGGPMQFDSNASIISGVSGTSYHDLDNTRLGHLNEAHAITDTELSLSQDVNERVFSPASVDVDARSELASSSFLSTDSMDVASLGRGQHGQYLQDDGSSSFISVASTSYLTNNESFSSQITLPESEDGSMASTKREVEF